MEAVGITMRIQQKKKANHVRLLMNSITLKLSWKKSDTFEGHKTMGSTWPLDPPGAADAWSHWFFDTYICRALSAIPGKVGALWRDVYICSWAPPDCTRCRIWMGLKVDIHADWNWAMMVKKNNHANACEILMFVTVKGVINNHPDDIDVFDARLGCWRLMHCQLGGQEEYIKHLKS